MRKYNLLFFVLTFVMSAFESAHAQEWKDVAPVFYQKCSTCHRPGEIGPFPIMSYADLANRSFLTLIPSVVNSGLMPPWKANPNYRHFLDERILTQQEKDLISDWVNSGIPAGDTSLAPPPPAFASGSQIGVPDLVLTMAEPHTIAGNGIDDYECFVLPTNLLQDQDISAIEFRPGNAAAVHHASIYLVPDSSAVYADKETSEYGYPSFGGIGPDVNGSFIAGYAPGLLPRYFPAHGKVDFPAGSFLVIQIHYAPLTNVTSDQSSVNLFFSNYADSRTVKAWRIGEGYIINPPFKIPADEVDTFYSEYQLSEDCSLFAIAPHQHLLGKSFKIFSISPTLDTIPLVYIPQWDFHWQMLYNYPYLVHLESGSIVHAIAVYDNTTNNPNNPNNPPIDVQYGENSTDEMFKYFIYTLLYKPGDEDIIIDSSYSSVAVPPIDDIIFTAQLYSCYPNPSSNKIAVSYYLPTGFDASITIKDARGRILDVRRIRSSYGLQKFDLDVTSYFSGEYFVVLQSKNKTLTKSFTVQR